MESKAPVPLSPLSQPPGTTAPPPVSFSPQQPKKPSLIKIILLVALGIIMSLVLFGRIQAKERQDKIAAEFIAAQTRCQTDPVIVTTESSYFSGALTYQGRTSHTPELHKKVYAYYCSSDEVIKSLKRDITIDGTPHVYDSLIEARRKYLIGRLNAGQKFYAPTAALQGYTATRRFIDAKDNGYFIYYSRSPASSESTQHDISLWCHSDDIRPFSGYTKIGTSDKGYRIDKETPATNQTLALAIYPPGTRCSFTSTVAITEAEAVNYLKSLLEADIDTMLQYKNEEY